MKCKDLKQQFAEEGIDEFFIRETLLPKKGFFDYKGQLTYTIDPLSTRSFGLDSDIAVISVYNGDQQKRWGFVVKTQKETSDVNLWGFRERSAQERYAIEASVLNNLGELPVLYRDNQRRRIIISQWEGSLDSLLAKAQNYISHARTMTGEISDDVIHGRERALQYVHQSMQTIVSVSSKLTEARQDLERSGISLRAKYSETDLREKLQRQLYAIIERSLDDVADPIKDKILLEFGERVYPDGDLTADLKTLAQDLSTGKTIIHYDTRTSNFLYKREVGDETAQELPGPENVRVTLCDLDRVRLGPLTHDLSYFLHDPYLLFLLPNRQERYDFFKKYVLQALPMLRKHEPLYENADPFNTQEFDGRCRRDFNKSTIVALIERTANPIQIETKNPAAYREYVGDRVLEDNNEVISRNLNLLFNHLNNIKAFRSLAYIVRKVKEARDGST